MEFDWKGMKKKRGTEKGYIGMEWERWGEDRDMEQNGMGEERRGVNETVRGEFTRFHFFSQSLELVDPSETEPTRLIANTFRSNYFHF